MEGTIPMVVTEFPQGGADRKLVCGRCRSAEPLGAIINGTAVHYRRKRGGEVWMDGQGFRALCGKCGTLNVFPWSALNS